jgi:hypothetical protein
MDLIQHFFRDRLVAIFVQVFHGFVAVFAGMPERLTESRMENADGIRNDACFSSVPFPLTPALSPGEREHRFPS